MQTVEFGHGPVTKPRAMALAIGAALGFLPLVSQAAGPLPDGGKFVAGTGSISGGVNQVNITQSSTRGVIDWRGFSIGQGNTVNVNNGSGATLSRVTGTAASVIDGKLNATGSFYLINPQGVVVGKNGVVTTGGRFLASTLDTDNTAFMAGGDLTFAGSSGASVYNLGKISSTGGDVILISRILVQNDGSISAPKGSAELVTGDQVLLHDSTSAPQTYVQGKSFGNVYSSGNMAAAQIALQAADGNVFALAGKNTAIRATGTTTRDGHVWLVAPNATAHMHTRIEAKNADGSGGIVDSTSKAVHLDDVDIHAGQWNLNTPAINVGPLTAAILTKQLQQGTSVSINATAGDINIAGLRWTGNTTLALNAHGSVTIVPNATLANTGSGNLTLRADAQAIDNGSGVNNRGAIDWSKSGGTVAVLYDMNGKWSPGTIRTNKGWSAAAFSGLQTQVTAYQLVNSRADLQNISNNLAGIYALGRDIDFSDSNVAFNPIGGVANTPFTGQFDGMKHSLVNMNLRMADDSQTWLGVFGVIGKTGVMRNLRLENANAYADNDGTVGVIAGLNQGLIVYSSTSGSAGKDRIGSAGGLVAVNDGTIARSSSSVAVSAYDSAGGLAASNSGLLIQSFSTGSAGGGSSRGVAGGLVTDNSGTITQSYAAGSAYDLLLAGITVFNSGKIEQSFVSSALARGFGYAPIGAIADSNAGTIANNVFFNTQLPSDGPIVGVVNGPSVPAANGLTTAQMSMASSFGPTWDFGKNGVWVIPAGGTHPVLRWQMQAQ